MLTFTNKYARNITWSQNGEEGLLLEILNRIKLPGKKSVEIGGNNGQWCSNTAYLIRELGWSGKFIEADWDLHVAACEYYQDIKDRVKCACSFVTADNVNAFVPADTDVLSIDTDGIDVQILRALQAKPAVIIVEINSGFPPDVEHESDQQGASYLTMAKAAIEKGYFILAHTGNLVLVDSKYRKKFPEIEGDGVSNAGEYFRRDWLKQTA